MLQSLSNQKLLKTQQLKQLNQHKILEKVLRKVYTSELLCEVVKVGPLADVELLAAGVLQGNAAQDIRVAISEADRTLLEFQLGFHSGADDVRGFHVVLRCHASTD